MVKLTELQADILEEKQDNPTADPSDIAESVGCSESHAYETLKEYDSSQLDGAEIRPSPERNSNSSSSSSSSSSGILFEDPGKDLFALLIIASIVGWLFNGGSF